MRAKKKISYRAISARMLNLFLMEYYQSLIRQKLAHVARNVFLKPLACEMFSIFWGEVLLCVRYYLSFCLQEAMLHWMVLGVCKSDKCCYPRMHLSGALND